MILNEVVNEYLALKISDIAKKEGIKLGVRDRCASDYVLLFPVFEDFFEEHIDQIKNIRHIAKSVILGFTHL